MDVAVRKSEGKREARRMRGRIVQALHCKELGGKVLDVCAAQPLPRAPCACKEKGVVIQQGSEEGREDERENRAGPASQADWSSSIGCLSIHRMLLVIPALPRTAVRGQPRRLLLSCCAS